MGIIPMLVFKFAPKILPHRCSVIVPAAGLSSRMNGIDKLFAEIAGKSVLLRTLERLSESKLVYEIIIVTSEENMEKVSSLCRSNGLSKVKNIVSGGDTRTQSVYNGLDCVDKKCDLIAVHDGARPLVPLSVIDSTIKAAITHSAAAPGVPVKDTLKFVSGGYAESTPDRSALTAIQTPQVFNAIIFKAAMEKAIKEGSILTDDCMAVEALKMKIKITDGSYSNIKITTPEDIAVAEALIKREEG